MQRVMYGIYPRNLRVFYLVDTLRAMWFVTSVWVLFEKQYLTLSQITMIEALITGVALCLQLPTGAFADIVGKRKTMIIGALLYMSSMIVYSFATSFPVFILYAFIIGFAQACTDGTREALLYDSLKQDHEEHNFAKIGSKLSMIFQVALAGATLIGGLIGLYSYTFVIRMSAFAFFFAAIASYFFEEPIIDSERFTVQGYVKKTREGISELFKNSYIKKISLYYILIGSLTWVTVITFNMMLLSELKYSTSEIGIAVAVGRIINSVILFRLLHIGTFFTRRRTFTLLPLVLIVCYTPVLFMTKWWAIVPVMGAMIVSGARWNILAQYTNAEFESKNRATAISALCMVIGIIFVLVVGASGYIMEQFGGIRIVYTALGIVTVCTALPLGLHLSNFHKNSTEK